MQEDNQNNQNNNITEKKKTKAINLKKIAIISFVIILTISTLYAYFYFNNQNNLKLKPIAQNPQNNIVEDLNKQVISLKEELNNLKQQDQKLENIINSKKDQFIIKKFDKLSFENNNEENISKNNNTDNLTQKTIKLQEEIEILNKKISNIDDNKNNNKLILLSINLRDSINSNRSYNKELKALKYFVGNDIFLNDNINILEKYSLNKIYSYKQLQAEFDKIFSQITNEYRKNKINLSLFDKFASYFSKILVIRKIDADFDSDDVEDILARAYQQLNQNNLNYTIKELEKLDENLYIIAKDWIINAQIYLQSRQTAENIFSYIAQKYNIQNAMNSKTN